MSSIYLSLLGISLESMVANFPLRELAPTTTYQSRLLPILIGLSPLIFLGSLYGYSVEFIILVVVLSFSNILSVGILCFF